MISMRSWIANSAPRELKATFFVVMAAFTNLSISLRQLLTTYLNKIFIITRSVSDGARSVTVPVNYDELGVLLFIVTAIGLLSSSTGNPYYAMEFPAGCWYEQIQPRFISNTDER